MPDIKHYVYSARTTEQGLALLNKTKGERSWDAFISEAIAAHYDIGIDDLTLPPSSFIAEREAKRRAREAEKATKKAEREAAAKAKAEAKAEAAKVRKAASVGEKAAKKAAEKAASKTAAATPKVETPKAPKAAKKQGPGNGK